jgi:NhaP-type Na+/H+ or K+/H+ antiporter
LSSLELVVAVGVSILVFASLARRCGIAPPVLLLIAGILLGFIPALRMVHLPPEAVLLLFLPILLYWESFTSSLREIPQQPARDRADEHRAGRSHRGRRRRPGVTCWETGLGM